MNMRGQPAPEAKILGDFKENSAKQGQEVTGLELPDKLR